MSCEVCVYQEGDNGPEFSNETIVQRSRKPATCYECSRTLPIGSSYYKIVGKWDGDLTTFRQCTDCYEIQHAFCCDGWVYGELWEGMEEQAFPELKMSGDCWDALSPPAKSFLLAQWRAWKFNQ